MNVKIIAEAGVNHNGDIGLAKELVIAGAEAGVDIVKFQTFKADKLVTKSAEKAQYQKNNCGADESQYAMLKKLELDDRAHIEIIDCCKRNGVEFLSTAFDDDSLEFLTKEVGLTALKLPSGEITNGPFIHSHARTGADLIVSTGMASLGEIEAALAVIAHGYCSPDETIEGLNDCFSAMASSQGQRLLRDKVTLLHCTSSYPAPMESVNLRAMDTLNKAFSLPVGYSDHTAGLVAPIAAVAMGASIIEKHFTLDCNMEGPDHKASLDPASLKQMVDEIRMTSSMLGASVKLPHSIELSTKDVARKSIVASKNITVGESFTEENITFLRPGTGLSPMNWWAKSGSRAIKNYIKGDLIE